MKKLILAALLAASPVSAQTYTITLTDQQVEAILTAGSQCEARMAYACAEYLVYIRNMLVAARQPKPALPPEDKK